MNEGGTQQPSPLAHNGAIFLNNTGGIIQALDGKTGDHLGAPARRATPRCAACRSTRTSCSSRRATAPGGARRAHGQGGLGHRRSPEGPQQLQRTAHREGQSHSGHGRLPAYVEEKCFISAYDAATGKQLWKFNTVAIQGEPGGDTWGKQHDLFRAGGETWITGSYDPDTNLTYWGTAQAKPWMPASRGMTTLDKALYTSSTVALDVDTGKLAWHFQHAPGEALDLDIVFERVLVDSGAQNLVFTVGKDGILWKLDRKTGKYLGHKETMFQNVWESASIRNRRAALPPRHHRRTRSASGSMAARAPKAATTGRR